MSSVSAATSREEELFLVSLTLSPYQRIQHVSAMFSFLKAVVLRARQQLRRPLPSLGPLVAPVSPLEAGLNQEQVHPALRCHL